MPLRRPISLASSSRLDKAVSFHSDPQTPRPRKHSIKGLPGIALLVSAILASVIGLIFWAKPLRPLPPGSAGPTGQSTSALAHDERDVKRVAVCFFGLTRSLNHTIESIRQNLTGPILKQGIEVDVFVHTYNDVARLINTRTGEDSELDPDQWRMLEPYDVSLTSQDEFLESIQCVPTPSDSTAH